MTSFDARLRLIGESGFPLGVEVDITGERMVVSAGQSVVADWPLDEITISLLADGFHIDAEGEEVVLNVTDERRFTIAIQNNSRLRSSNLDPGSPSK